MGCGCKYRSGVILARLCHSKGLGCTHGGDAGDLLGLLDVSDNAEDHGEHVERVPHDVQQVPHVPDVLPEALRSNFLDLFPKES